MSRRDIWGKAAVFVLAMVAGCSEPRSGGVSEPIAPERQVKPTGAAVTREMTSPKGVKKDQRPCKPGERMEDGQPNVPQAEIGWSHGLGEGGEDAPYVGYGCEPQ